MRRYPEWHDIVIEHSLWSPQLLRSFTKTLPTSWWIRRNLQKTKNEGEMLRTNRTLVCSVLKLSRGFRGKWDFEKITIFRWGALHQTEFMNIEIFAMIRFPTLKKFVISHRRKIYIFGFYIFWVSKSGFNLFNNWRHRCKKNVRTLLFDFKIGSDHFC